MPRFDAFCGPFDTAASPNTQSELTINWIPERNSVSVNQMGEDVTDKNIRCSLIRTPGLKIFTTLPKSPVRCLCPGEYRLFAAAGDSWYEIFGDGSFVDRSAAGFTGSSGNGPAGGSIGNNNLPVQAFTNGNQVLIVSAGQAYCDNGNGPVPCQFSDPLSDLVVDPADTSGKTLTTATGNFFDQTDVGRTVQINGGPGWNYITQVITSVNTQGEAIGASAWGVPGAGLGTGVEFLGNISYSDLAIAGPQSVGSSARPFGPSSIGTSLTITGGTGFTTGTYKITGLVYDASGNPTGIAILDRSPGTAGSTGGTGSTADAMVTASQGAFLDGYFFVTPYPQTENVYFSAVKDGTSWNPLDFFVKTYFADNVLALFSDHEELYTFGDLESTQVWRDVGDATNPFQPDPGGAMHIGAQAQFAVVRLANGVAWLGQDTHRGTRRAYHAVGYNPVPVSTPALEAQWKRYSDISDAVAFTIAINGHELWVINFPTANVTWAYDASTQWWTQWGWWNGTGWDRIRTWVHCVVAFAAGSSLPDAHFGGDWQSGKIYTISDQYKTDDGNMIVRRRRAPHFTKENMRRFYSRFEIDCDRLGGQRVFWNRLGNGRDRVWQMDSSQASETAATILTLGYSDDATKSFQTFFTQSIDPSVDVMLSNAYLRYVDATWN